MLRHLYRKRIWLSGCLILFVSLLLFKDCITARVFELYLSRTLQKEGWSVEHIQVEKNRILIQGVSGEGISIQQVDVLCHVSLVPFVFQPQIVLSHVAVSLQESSLGGGSGVNLLGLIMGSSSFDPRIKIEEGELSCSFSESVFSFQFDPGEEKHKLGSLLLKEKGEEKPFFIAGLSKKNKELTSTIEIVEANALHLLPWITSQTQKWDKLEGVVNAYIQCSIHQEKGLESLQANVSLDKVNLQSVSSDYTVQAKSLEGTLSFSGKELLPLWKQLDLFITFEDLLWMTKQGEFGFTNTLGEIRLQPTEDPYVKVGGTLKTKGSLMPFELEGSGEVLEKGACWLQTNLSFFLPHSQPKIIASFWQSEEGKGVLETHWEQVGKEVSEVYQELGSFFNAPKYLLEKGEIEGKLLAKCNLGVWHSVELSDCSAKNFIVSIPSKKVRVQAQSASLRGVLEKEEIVSLQGEIRKGSLSLEQLEVEEIVAKVDIVEGELMPSYLEGSYQGAKVAMQILAPTAEALLHIECGLHMEDLQKFFPMEYKIQSLQKDPIFVVLDLFKEAEDARFVGTVRFPSTATQPQDMDIQGVIHKTLSRKIADLTSSWDLSTAEGTFSLEQLSAKTVFPYCKDLFTELQLQGSCNLTGSFTQKKIEVDLSSLDLSLQKDSYRLMGQIGNKEPLSFIYDKETGCFEGRAFVDSLFIEDKARGMSFEVVDTIFRGKDQYIWADEGKVAFEGLELLGSFTYDGNAVHIASKAYEGDMKTLKPLFKKYFSQKTYEQLEGRFSLEDKAYIAKMQRGEEGWGLSWTLSAKLSQLSYDLGVGGKIKEGQAVITTGSKGGFCLKDVRGQYDLATFSSELFLNDFQWIPGEKADFYLTAKEGAKEALALSGVILPEEAGYTFHISPYSHILGLELAIEPIQIRNKEISSLLKGSCCYKWQQLSSYVALLKQMGFALPEYKIPKIEGDAKLQIVYDRKTSQTQLRIGSQELIYEGKSLGNVACDLYHKEGFWKIDPCQVGPYFFSGKMRKQENKWILEGLSFKSLETKVLAEGTYDPALAALTLPSFSFSFEKEKDKIEAKGSFKGSFSQEGVLQGLGSLEKMVFTQDLCSFLAKKGMVFAVSSQEGMRLEKSQWDCLDLKQNQLLAKVNVQSLTYLFTEQKLIMTAGLIKSSKEGVLFLKDKLFVKDVLSLASDKEITIQLDAEVSSNYKKILGSVKNGSLDLLGVGVDVKNIQLLQEKERLYLSCQTLFQSQPVWIQWQSRSDLLGSAALILKGDVKDPGLSIQLEKVNGKSWAIQSAVGSFQGLDLKLEKIEPLDKKNFSYNTQLKVDFSKLSSLLPEKSKGVLQKCGVGQGYSYLGVITLDPSSFSPVSLSGKLQAEEFVCFGRTLHSLKAKVQLAKGVFSAQELLIEDEVGLVTVKTMEARLQPETGLWLLTAPIVHVKDFSPATFVKGGEKGAVIKNISFYQLKGFLQDINSFEATGALNFVKPIKKELSFWDIPLNLMKDFGLDTGLLTPVIGEAEFTLTQGRCYFTLLKNMYSEGERSQFVLAGSSSDAYLSLDGTWHVDLKMKQNVVWKVTEDLILSIRGTLEKPKYSFKWRDNGS